MVETKALAEMRKLVFVLLMCLLRPPGAMAADAEYLLGIGDVVRIAVFRNPDLATEARVSEDGAIAFPLIGTVKIRGQTLPMAEKQIAELLKDGGFVLKPQVSILLVQSVSNQVAVLGQVNNPGRYSIEASGGHLSGVLAAAGGVAADGSDVIIVTGTRDERAFRREIDIVALFNGGKMSDDLILRGGDTVFVNRAAMFYIYGEVQRAGAFRLARGMTVVQAIATGGGMTEKGTARGIVVRRRDGGGDTRELSMAPDALLQDADVVYVKEALF